MPLFKVTDAEPPEGERVLIHRGGGRLELGRREGGRWYVEDARDGRLSEAEGVTHWGPLLASEEYDPADD